MANSFSYFFSSSWLTFNVFLRVDMNSDIPPSFSFSFSLLSSFLISFLGSIEGNYDLSSLSLILATSFVYIWLKAACSGGDSACSSLSYSCLLRFPNLATSSLASNSCDSLIGLCVLRGFLLILVLLSMETHLKYYSFYWGVIYSLMRRFTLMNYSSWGVSLLFSISRIE